MGGVEGTCGVLAAVAHNHCVATCKAAGMGCASSFLWKETGATTRQHGSSDVPRNTSQFSAHLGAGWLSSMASHCKLFPCLCTSCSVEDSEPDEHAAVLHKRPNLLVAPRAQGLDCHNPHAHASAHQFVAVLCVATWALVWVPPLQRGQSGAQFSCAQLLSITSASMAAHSFPPPRCHQLTWHPGWLASWVRGLA